MERQRGRKHGGKQGNKRKALVSRGGCAATAGGPTAPHYASKKVGWQKNGVGRPGVRAGGPTVTAVAAAAAAGAGSAGGGRGAAPAILLILPPVYAILGLGSITKLPAVVSVSP